MEKDKGVIVVEGTRSLARVGVQLGLVEKVLEEIYTHPDNPFDNIEFIDVVKALDSLVFEILQTILEDRNDRISPYTKTSIYTPDYIAYDSIKKDNYNLLARLIKHNLKDLIDESEAIPKILGNFDLVFNEYIKKTDMPFKNVGAVKLDDEGFIKEVETIEGTRNKGNLLEGNETVIHQDISVVIKSIIKSLKQPAKNFTEEEYDAIKEDPDLEFDYYETLKYLGYAERVNMSQTINKIYHVLEGANNYPDMLKKLREKAYDNPEFWELLDKLPSEENLKNGNFKALDVATQFVSSFMKKC